MKAALLIAVTSSLTLEETKNNDTSDSDPTGHAPLVHSPTHAPISEFYNEQCCLAVTKIIGEGAQRILTWMPWTTGYEDDAC